jgi:hypothetical protein
MSRLALLASRRTTFVALGYLAVASLVIPSDRPVYAFHAIVGVVALSIGASMSERTSSVRSASTALRTAVVLMSIVPFFVSGYRAPETWIVAPGLGIALLVVALTREDRRLSQRMKWIGVLVVSGFVIWLGVHSILVLETPPIDVIKLHDSAAEELGAGRNPYRYAHVDYEGAWTEAHPRWTAGYAYPPTTMLMYAGGSAGLGDSRWISVLAVLTAVLIVGRPWLSVDSDRSRLDLVAAAAIGLQFGHMLVFMNGWTEPLAVPIAALALLWWRRHPTASWVVLGLLFSTKQYFASIGVALLAIRDSKKWKRLAVVAAVSIAVSAPVVLWDVEAFLDSAVFSVLKIPPRMDSLNLLAFGLRVPPWIGILLVVGMATVLGRRITGPGSFGVVAASLLGVQFLVGYAAFANYWYLIAAMAALALWADDELALSATVDTPDSDGLHRSVVSGSSGPAKG